MSTFNGKTWAEAVDYLRSARPTKKQDNGQGKPYVDIVQFFRFMDEAFDGLYSYDMSEPYHLTLANGQEAVSVKVTLTIFDDDGNRRCSYAGAGTIPYYMNNKGKCTNIQQAYPNAALSAFKDACKGLGIFGYRRTVIEETGQQPQTGGSSSGAGKASAPKKNRESLVFHTEGSMFAPEKDGVPLRDKDNRPVWKVGGNVDKKPAELIFYPSYYNKNTDKFNSLYSKCSTGKLSLRVVVTPCGEREGKAQYVFYDYAS